MQSRSGELGLRSLDVSAGASDCFFRSVSHQLYGNSKSNTKNSWLRYLNNMSIQGTWADALIIQTVADVLKVTIQIVESY